MFVWKWLDQKFIHFVACTNFKKIFLNSQNSMETWCKGANEWEILIEFSQLSFWLKFQVLWESTQSKKSIQLFQCNQKIEELGGCTCKMFFRFCLFLDIIIIIIIIVHTK